MKQVTWLTILMLILNVSTHESAGNLALTVLEGSIDGLRHQGRPKRQWMDDIEEWSSCSYIQLKEMSQDREQWRRKTIEWSSANMKQVAICSRQPSSPMVD